MGDEREESYEYVGMLGGIEEEEHDQYPVLEDDQHEYVDDLDEEGAIAPNSLIDVEDADDHAAGDAIQLQLAAHAAPGEAKGTGEGKSFKGKAKGKVVLVCSHWSSEQRRAKLAELKNRS